MSYPHNPGYQAGSETSEAAAINLTGKDRANATILSWMERKGEFGMTIDEASVLLSEVFERQIPPGTASARMRELELTDKISKTPKKRRTRTGSPANVYIIGTWSETLLAKVPPIITNPEPPETALQRLQRYEAQLSIHGHGRTVPFTAIIQRTGGKKPCRTMVCKICAAEKTYMDQLKKAVEAEQYGSRGN